MKESGKKRTHADRQRLLTQIFCIVLAALMLLGVLAAILPYAMMQAYAADVPAVTAQTTDADAAEEPDNGLPLRIGLMFGSDVTPSFDISTARGFTFGSVDDETDCYTPYFTAVKPAVSICQDTNLTYSTDEYYVPASKNLVIGGFHLELPAVYRTAEELQAGVAAVNAKLSSAGIYSSLIYAFPAYDNGKLTVRIGDYGSYDSAAQKISLLKTATGDTAAVVSPDTKNGLTVLSTGENLILFEYSSKDGMLGIAPLPDKDGREQVIRTPASNTYQGVFVFGRWESGVSVTNLIPLEQYVAGVIPYEINNTWGIECLKAFTVIVRSFALSNLDGHPTYGIDLCNGNECQVYMGTKSQNEAVLRAVDETRGLVITADGEICSTIYSAVTGGCTVDVEQIWNGRSYSYLRAVTTPWEDYASHTYGTWQAAVTGSELYAVLASKGYKLKGAVADVTIAELAHNSTYVYRLKVTDVYGNTVELKGTDVIRIALGKYVKSANFVVGHNGDIPILNKPLTVLTADGTKKLNIKEEAKKQTIEVMTADGVKTVDITTGLPVVQDDGTRKVFSEKDYVLTDKEQSVLNTAGNKFVFIGKGWGHGGGISQWGAKNMAELGYTWHEIIDGYFTGVTVCSYKDVFPS